MSITARKETALKVEMEHNFRSPFSRLLTRAALHKEILDRGYYYFGREKFDYSYYFGYMNSTAPIGLWSLVKKH